MVRGHKFAKLKSANHQNLAIHQILLPPNLPAIQYNYTCTCTCVIYTVQLPFCLLAVEASVLL